MDYLLIASYIGTVAFAISGIILGMRKDLDIMGVFIMAFLTATGGGILRDILLNRVPVFFSDQSIYISIIVLIIIFKFLRSKDIINKLEGSLIFRISDTVGLVSFAITGGVTALAFGVDFFNVILISFLSAVGGGIIRDTMVNEIPVILRSGFYGSVAVIVGLALYFSDYFGIDKNIYIPTVFILGIVIRLLAIKINLQLPKV